MHRENGRLTSAPKHVIYDFLSLTMEGRTTEWVRPLETLTRADAKRFGHKAVRLGLMMQHGLPVPQGFALAADACRAFRQAQQLQRHRDDSRAANPMLPIQVARCLDDIYRTLSQSGSGPYIVRSSSALEDGVTQSAAGMFESQPDKKSLAQIYDAAKAIWSHTREPMQQVYGHRHRIEEAMAMGDIPLIIQRQIDTSIEGVLFSMNPTTGNPSEWVLQVSTRAKEAAVGVVTSGVGHDQIIHWDMATGAITDVLSDGPLLLGEAEFNRLLSLAWKTRGIVGQHIDIEFAIEKENDTSHIWLLQSRPVTAAVDEAPPTATTFRPVSLSTVWTQANVGEALWGPVTPLTWSVLHRFSQTGFDTLLSTLGCRMDADVQKVARIRGRVYLNMTALAQALSQVPGVNVVRLQALGGGHLPMTQAEFESFRQPGDQTKYMLKVPWLALKGAERVVRLNARWRLQREAFTSEYQRLSEVQLSILPLLGLDRLLMDAELLLARTGSWLLEHYAYLLMQAQGLGAVTGFDFASQAQQNSAYEAVSLTLGSELAAIAQSLCQAKDEAECAVREKILNDDLEQLGVDQLEPSTARTAIENFLRRYGHRAVRETELAVPRWREDASWVFAVLKAYLRNPNAAVIVNRERPKSGVLKQWAESYLQKWLSIREEVRDDVVKTLGVFRDIALEISCRLDPGGEFIQAPHRIPMSFFLSLEEIHSFLRGHHEARDFQTRVKGRLGEYHRQWDAPELPTTFRGWPATDPLDNAAKVEAHRWRGLATSPGIAEGPVRILKDVRELARFNPGEVLVVPQADVGWTSIFPMAKAVITELGGPLSHAGIIAREYGVPAVFNVENATRVIQDGDWVRVDGYEGVFERRH